MKLDVLKNSPMTKMINAKGKRKRVSAKEEGSSITHLACKLGHGECISEKNE